MEMAGVGAADGRAALSWRFPAAEELVGYSPGVRQFFFVQDMKLILTLLRDRVAKFAIDSQHSQWACENDRLALPSIRLEDAEQALGEGHHPTIAERIKG